MNKTNVIFKTVVLTTVTCLLSTGLTFGAKMNAKKAEKWVNKKEWANGFKAVPYEGTDCLEFAKQYAKNKALWDQAFEWLASHDLATMPAGKYPIDGDRCFINVQDARTKDPSQCKIEGHRKYIDLQYIVVGTERFGLVNPVDATVSEPYKGDNTFYTAPTDKIKYVDSNPQIFFLFFPKNYHQALVKAGEPASIRKVVAKIEYLAD